MRDACITLISFVTPDICTCNKHTPENVRYIQSQKEAFGNCTLAGVQQNFFNPSSDNLLIMPIWHLRVVPKLDVLPTVTSCTHIDSVNFIMVYLDVMSLAQTSYLSRLLYIFIHWYVPHLGGMASN